LPPKGWKGYWDPEDDPFATRGIPVFQPTINDFDDFEGFMEKVESWGVKSGIVKIVPPKEWCVLLKVSLRLIVFLFFAFMIVGRKPLIQLIHCYRRSVFEMLSNSIWMAPKACSTKRTWRSAARTVYENGPIFV
jgi:hypothetical protein